MRPVAGTRPFYSAMLLAALLPVGCCNDHHRLQKAMELEAQGDCRAALPLYADVLRDTPGAPVTPDLSVTGWKPGTPPERSGRPSSAAAQQGAREAQAAATSSILLHFGECLWKLDRPADAFHAFEEAARTAPSNPDANLRLARILLTAGLPERAAEYAGRVLTQDPQQPDALAVMGSVYAAQGNLALAVAQFQRGLRLQPGRVSVAIELADLYLRQAKTSEARALLLETADAQPGSAVPWLALARLDEQKGDAAAAERDYRKAIAVEDNAQSNLRYAEFLERGARIAEAEKILRHADNLHPAQTSLWADFQLLSGKALGALGDYLDLLQRAAHGQRSQPPAPASPAGPGSQLSPILAWWGGGPGSQPSPILSRTAGWGGDPRRAALAARVIEADLESSSESAPPGTPDFGVTGSKPANPPASPPAELARLHLAQRRQDLDAATIAMLEAEIALQQGDLTRAASQAGASVELAPHSPAASYLLGVVRYREGKEGAARVVWEKSLELDPAYTPARLALAVDALRRGDNLTAEEHVATVVRDEPGNFRALTLYARVLAAEERYEAARQLVHRAQALDGAAAEPHVILGNLALQQRRPAEALLELHKAVLLEPRSAAAIEGMTRVFRHGRVTRRMLRQMENVAEAPPRSPTLMEIVGRLYAGQGWREEARHCLQRALEMDGSRATAAMALTRSYAAAGELAAAASSAGRADHRTEALLAALRAEQDNDFAAAVRNYELAVRRSDGSGVAANNLAWLYALQGVHLDRALELARSAAQWQPRDPAVLDTLGFVHLKRREYSQAIEVLKRADELSRLAGEIPQARRNPDPAYAGEGPGSVPPASVFSQLRRHLAEAYRLSGQPAQAATLEAGHSDGK